MSKKGQQNRTSKQVLAALDMKLTADNTSVFILVEGSTDRNLFKNFFDMDKVKIENTHGKQNLIDVVTMIGQNKLSQEIQFFAIKDADFDRINKKEDIKNIFLTDLSDLETMMLNTSILDKLVTEHGQESKLEGKDVLQILLNEAKLLGAFRLLNEIENLNLKFKELTFSKFINKQNLKLDIDDMIKTVLNHSKKNDLSIENLKLKIGNIVSQNYDLLQLCNGHDLVELLSIALTKLIGNKGQQDVKVEALESSLRISYRIEDFKLTELYAKIIEWEKQNGKEVFKKM